MTDSSAPYVYTKVSVVAEWIMYVIEEAFLSDVHDVTVELGLMTSPENMDQIYHKA